MTFTGTAEIDNKLTLLIGDTLSMSNFRGFVKVLKKKKSHAF